MLSKDDEAKLVTVIFARLKYTSRVLCLLALNLVPVRLQPALGGGGWFYHPENQVLSKLHVVYQQLQANQKSQQDEIENRLKEIQKEVKA